MSEAVSAPAATVPGARVGPVFGALMLVMLMASLDSTIVSTALPTIAGDLGGISKLPWVVTAYLLTSTITTPVAGKLGDLYGRKLVLQSALVVFLIGSALCGLSSNMTELILFRGLQGLGGGALMVGTQAVIGDIVSPRERGRYSGLMGGVFGVSTVVGPLIGGLFVDHLSWNWIFYINLPIGVVTLVVLQAVLHVPSTTVQRSIDYAGMSLLAISLTSIVLYTSLGGNTYGWWSPRMILLLALSVVAAAAFVLVERRAREPILPLSLFSNRVFTVASVIGFIVGASLFGSVTYLPLYLQIVKGASPTESGLELLPLMAGVLIASIGSGQVITRAGRYKVFPIVGTALMVVGMFLLARLGAGTSLLVADVYMFVVGLGLGFVMQVLILAVQNAVEYRDLGVATASATLFRSIGGTIGVPIFGAIFTNQLASHLAAKLPPGAAEQLPAHIGPGVIEALPDAIKAAYRDAYATSLHPVFLLAAGLAVVAFAFTWLLEERPLRQTVADQGIRDSFASPRDPISMDELEARLSSLARKENRGRVYAHLAEVAGIEAEPREVWLLLRLEECTPCTPDEIAARYEIPAPLARGVISELEQRGLVAASGDSFELTTAGAAAASALVRARHSELERFLEEWQPSQHPEVLQLLERFARSLRALPPAGEPAPV
ncbi:MAG TPA: MDR family MFS transporter [Gaiellaceae bacterium]|nr:MDR family MFS transporter [Gaiellaceae bacterium]